MNVRQLLYKQNRLKGMNQYNAAKAAGYSENVARKHPDRLEKVVIGGILEALEQQGMTDKYQAKQLMQLSDHWDGNLRLNTLKHIADLKGQIKGRIEHSGKVGGVTVNVTPSRTIVFTGIDDLNETDLQDIHATQSESSPRFGEDASSS